MGGTWSAEQLRRFEAAEELEVGGRRWTPVWVVRAGDQVYVRTWQRRDTGWYGRVRREGTARVRVPGLEADVVVEGTGDAERAGVDAAYRAKYGRYGEATVGRMVSDEAAASTLRLTP